MSYEISSCSTCETVETGEHLESIHCLFNQKMVLSTNYNELFCHVKENQIFIDYRYLKFIYKDENAFDVHNKATNNNIHSIHSIHNIHIIMKIIEMIKHILQKYDDFIIHISFKNFTIMDLDKKYRFITEACEMFQREIPLKMKKCNIYNAPFIFSHLYKIISSFLSKETRQRIHLYK